MIALQCILDSPGIRITVLMGQLSEELNVQKKSFNPNYNDFIHFIKAKKYSNHPKRMSIRVWEFIV